MPWWGWLLLASTVVGGVALLCAGGYIEHLRKFGKRHSHPTIMCVKCNCVYGLHSDWCPYREGTENG